jgi:hypothetical protein
MTGADAARSRVIGRETSWRIMSDDTATKLRNGFCILALVSLFAAWARLIPWWAGLPASLAMLLAAAVVVTLVEQRFREYVFVEKFALTGLPPQTMDFFSRTSAALDELQFERIGDFCLLPEPIPKYARIYASPDGDCFACLYTSFAGTTRVSYLAFCSVTADGTYIESACYGGKYSLNPDVPLRFRYLDGTSSAGDALRQHREFVEQHTSGAQAKVLALRPDHFRQVLAHGHRLAHWEQYHAACGNAPSAAEAPDGAEDSPWSPAPEELAAAR